jgi:hypothetical protein
VDVLRKVPDEVLAKDVKDSAQPDIDNAAQTAAGAVNNIAADPSGTARKAADTASDAVDNVVQKGSEVAGQARDKGEL